MQKIPIDKTRYTEYLWIATDGTLKQYGKIVLGGYPDTITTAVGTIPGKIKIIDGGEIPRY